MKFKAGNNYGARSTGDYDCVFEYSVIKRTDKSLWLQVQGELKRLKIHCSDGVEHVFPLGHYAFCPCLRADKEI